MKKFLVIAGLVLVVGTLASTLLSVSGLASGYERGYAATIRTYADRSYEGAEWTLLKESDSFSTVNNMLGVKINTLHSIAGWDADNLWIASDGYIPDYGAAGVLYHIRDGQWVSGGYEKSAREPEIAVIDTRDIYVVGTDDVIRLDDLYRVSGSEWSSLGETFPPRERHGSTLAVLAPNVAQHFVPDQYDKPVATIIDNTVTMMPPDKYREALVHRRDNTPLKEFPVGAIQCVQTDKAGHAVAIANSQTSSEDAIVEFENGFWYVKARVDGLSRLGSPFRLKTISSWLGRTSDGSDVMFMCGDEGRVWLLSLGGKKRVIPVSGAQETTSHDLIAIWGVDDTKFWTMDRSGTVWERSEGEYRVVVRGMYRDDVEFDRAWVAPTGEVFAITEDELYELR